MNVLRLDRHTGTVHWEKHMAVTECTVTYTWCLALHLERPTFQKQLHPKKDLGEGRSIGFSEVFFFNALAESGTRNEDLKVHSIRKLVVHESRGKTADSDTQRRWGSVSCSFHELSGDCPTPCACSPLASQDSHSTFHIT